MRSSDSHKSRVFYSHACSLPWTTLLVNYDGEISFCCFHYPFAKINTVSENAMDEIWNGEVAQRLRRRWNEGRLQGTPCANCFGLRMFRKYGHPVENMPDMSAPTFDNAQLNIHEFQEGKAILKSMPVEIVYIPSVLCNLRCIHCFQPPVGKYNNTYIEPGSLLKFYHYLGSRAARNVFSGGEPLYLRQTYQLIGEFSPDHKAASEAVFQTNGMLIRNKFQSIAGFKKYGFRISISSFRKETYEHIQKGATFERLIENLEFLKRCKSEGMDISMTLIIVLMKSNFVDLASIFEFAETHKFDEVWVLPVQEAFGKGEVLQGENIFTLPYLLERIPSWRDILSKASSKAMTTGNRLTGYHLEYIQNQLSSSVVVNRYRSVWNLFVWLLRRTILRLLFSSAKTQRLVSVWRRLRPVLTSRNFSRSRRGSFN